MRLSVLLVISCLAFSCGSDNPLAGTNLPKSFSECVDRGGGVYERQDGVQVCLWYVDSESDPELYQECIQAGGGEVVGDYFEEDIAVYSCKITYPEDGPPCLGNACD